MLIAYFNKLEYRITEILKQNLYKIGELSLNEKSKIIKIIQNENFDEENKATLTNILNNLSIEDFNSLLGKDFKPEKKSKIKIPNFKQKVMGFLDELISKINGTVKQKDFLGLKASTALNGLIMRANCSEIIIPSYANLKIIAGAIVYAIIQSEKDIPRLTTGKEIMEKLNIKQGSVHDYYHIHLKHLYPRAKKQSQIDKEINKLKNIKYSKHYFTSIRGIQRIREIISLCFFDILVKSEVATKDLVSYLKNIIKKKTKLPIQLTHDDILILQKLSKHPDFDDYFSDLGEIVKYLITSSRMHKKIGAHLIISYTAKTLMEKGVNLFQTAKTFHITLINIFDCLKENYNDFLPTRSSIEFTTIEKRERWAIDRERAYIIGSRIKLFIIKNIYSGKYNKNGKTQCSECNKEGFTINTDISRLEAMEFNHISGNKIYEYTKKVFYDLFTQSYGDPDFLEKLIFKMESEKVELICRNHHNLHHSKYFKYFKYLINWNEMFSLSPVLIHLVIRIAVNSFHLTKNFPKQLKSNIRRSIIIDLKRRYIINTLYSGKCPICEEFNAKDHISVFQGHHEIHGIKKREVSNLFYIGLSCSEIVKILKAEHVGFICGNCHTVIQYVRDESILNQIYDNKEIVNKIIADYKQVHRKFKTINDEKSLIKDPLKKAPLINDNFIKYLFSINETSKSEREINANVLSRYLGVSTGAVRHFLYDRGDLLKPFIKVVQDKPKTLKRYSLTDYGKKAIALLQHFRDYYRSSQ